MNRRKFLRKILQSQTNIRFADIIWLVEGFGFRLNRTAGSHHIYIHTPTGAMINIQSVHGQAKPYQITQLLKLIEQYDLTLVDD
jgi:predicted RNA binding protein YcfA (HicA-like mRNA interferase family)